MGYIQPFDRNQLTLPESLDSYISCENPVRLIDVFVDQFIKLHPDFSSYKGSSPTGRSAYSFGTLLKLYVYGYLNSISSSRKLERETLRNMELIRLRVISILIIRLLPISVPNKLRAFMNVALISAAFWSAPVIFQANW
ncbi:transposase [Bacteroides thetaiotaomicron]|nr:transposase [Bacteroides thetaiotaomicron]